MPRYRNTEEDRHFSYEPVARRRASGHNNECRDEARRSKPSPHHHPRKVASGEESFKCGRCRAFIGPTVSGGRHRNHCPLCLYSRHVDRGRPGDRACDCRSLMEAVGLCTRRNGEQMIVHRCLGCEVDRVCRVAADDNPLTIMRLPLVAHPSSHPVEDHGFEFDEEMA